MNVPSGYSEIGLIGYTDRGDYASNVTYVKNDLVHYSGGVWRCLIDDTTGVEPREGVNWTIFVQLPESAAESLIAPIESDAGASERAYAIGERFILNNTMYKAKRAISIGDELVEGTNYELADDVSTQLDNKANKTEAFLINETTENTLADADTVPFYDASASSKRKTTWSNIVSKIKTSLSKSDVGLGNVPNVSTNDQTPTFTQASTRANIASGEKLSTIFGKIMRVIADLKAVAFSGAYSDLSGKPTIFLQAKNFDANFKTKYRTETRGSSSGGEYISTIRTNDSVADAPQHGSGLAWGQGDTHGYLDVAWGTEGGAWIGGGNGDNLNWVAELYTTLHKPSKSDVGLGNVDNTADANKSVYYSSFTGNIRRFDYVGDTDLNNYNQTGICNVTADSQAKMTLHFPIGTASTTGEGGQLFVDNADNNGTYIKQTYITRSGRIFTRIFDIFTGAWSDWKAILVPKIIPVINTNREISMSTDTFGFVEQIPYDGIYTFLIQTSVSTSHDIFVLVGEKDGTMRTVAQQYMTYMYQCLNVTLPLKQFQYVQVKTAVPNCNFNIRIHRVTE